MKFLVEEGLLMSTNRATFPLNFATNNGPLVALFCCFFKFLSARQKLSGFVANTADPITQFTGSRSFGFV